MIHAFVRFKVKDFTAWKPVFDGNAGIRKAAGEVSNRVFYNSDNPSDVILFFEWDSRAKAEAFIQSDAVRKGMSEGGVIGSPDVIFVEESRQLRRTAAD